MLIDSNILIYAINTSSPKHQTAQFFLQDNIGQLEVAHQNIFETLRVLTHPKFSHPMQISSALEAVESILRGCSIVSPDYKTHRIAIELVKKYKLVSDQVFDAYLAATAISNGIKILASDNLKDLGKFTEFTVLNPFSKR
jgi:predicted nucleic acid-binding protein